VYCLRLSWSWPLTIGDGNRNNIVNGWRYQMRRAIGTLVLAFAVTLAGMAVAPGSASAQTVSCNTITTRVADVGGYELVLPSRGNSLECFLRRSNNYNEAVEPLQRTLNRCFGESLDVDGFFGELTFEALQRAQSEVGTDDDGVYGRDTRNEIERDRKWRAVNNNTPSPDRCAGAG
jgi:Putative peptidoglycan binding domain